MQNSAIIAKKQYTMNVAKDITIIIGILEIKTFKILIKITVKIEIFETINHPVKVQVIIN